MRPTKRASGALIVSKLTERVMFSIRAPHKTHRLTWGLWGGMLNQNETYEEGLYREVKEEMGILPVFLHTELFDTYHSKDSQFIYNTFICVVEKEFAPWVGSENCGYCWLDLGIWPKPLHYGAKKTFLSRDAECRLRNIIKSI